MRKSHVVEYFGTKAQLFHAMNQAGYSITRQAIHKWPEVIPKKRAEQIREIIKKTDKRKSIPFMSKDY